MAKKRQTNPGVRVIGRRIYDSKNGKSCHQCRQKTLDFAAPCKVMKKNKLCPIKFCYKCLSNRYGENAEEVAKLDDWILESKKCFLFHWEPNRSGWLHSAKSH